VLAFGNRISRNCQGILVLDDGQRGGVGDAALVHNRVVKDNKLCPKNDEMPFDVKGGRILLLVSNLRGLIPRIFRGTLCHRRLRGTPLA
jgi:hypothetical protein